MKKPDYTKFENFKLIAGDRYDISRFENSFFHMLDINGAVPSYTIGFNFCLDDEEYGTLGTDEALDIFNTFSPIVIFVGTEELQQKLSELGYYSTIMSWFEDGGFAVVLKVPAKELED